MIALTICCLWFASTVCAGNIDFLAKTPAGQFNEADWKLLHDTIVRTLTDSATAAARTWRNAANDHQGSVRILKAWQDASGRSCKRFRLDNTAGGYKGAATYTACMEEDGSWRTTDGLKL